MLSDDPTSRDARLERLEQLVSHQQDTIAALEGRVAASTEGVPKDDRVTRRGLLTAAGAAAAGAVAATVVGAAPAGADVVGLGTADGHALQIGGANTGSSTAPTGLAGNQGGGFQTSILKVTQLGQHHAIWAEQEGASTAAAILARSTNVASEGIGVVGQKLNGTGGIGVRGQTGTPQGIGLSGASSQGPGLQLDESFQTMPPTTLTWQAGSFVVTGGHVWYCSEGGLGSASRWQRLSSSFVPLPSPVRVFDSRGGPNAGLTPQGPLTFTAAPPSAAARDVNCALATGGGPAAPPGATAVLLNLAVVTISGVGALNAYAHGSPQPGTANINWTAGGQVISNGVTSACDVNRHVDIAIVASAGASTQFIVDVVGYYL